LKNDKGTIIDGKIEGAPHLRAEHYAVFDTANRCGTGKRAISPDGHVKMMGALAPHVSGAISKTVNLPREATLDDVKSIYKLSWKLGVKAIALYRDGCKVCQPLNTTIEGQSERQLSDYTYQELIDYINTKKPTSKPHRVKPSGIRNARVHEAAINGLKLYITASFYEDGRLGEIYVSSGREGSLTKGLLDSMSTTISEMLQYGVPPADIARMYRGQKYEPSGAVTGHPYIKFVDSISDLISKIIDIELGNFQYCQVKPEGYEVKSAEEVWKEVSTRRYTEADYIQHELCPNCKSRRMVKNGTCKICTECGTTTGCS
ncbi:MAG: ribonucleoside-diphosphate reductase, partial [Clostridiales bacterium]|nr:ribonucleoside-diphosphate reductase [Clostridiales bacterium]